MQLYFGLNVQSDLLHHQAGLSLGKQYVDPKQFLLLLEQHLGLVSKDEDIEYLRVEQYRQALKHYLAQAGDAFFKNAFVADDLGVAADLLKRRDELLVAKWDFKIEAITPERLALLAKIESYWKDDTNTLKLYAGKADRLLKLQKHINRATHFIEQIQLCDPLSDFPLIWQTLLADLTAVGVQIDEYAAPEQFKDTDLGTWQACLQGQKEGAQQLKADGSLLIIKAYRETHLAAWMAKLLANNQDFRPAILLPQAKRSFENALIKEDLASLGVASASLARPSLQVLKLASVFLWEPIDLYKLMEFVSLGVKPLDADLAERIAGFLANTPGLYSERWFAMINDYFTKHLPEKAKKHTQLNVAKIQQQYDFWFKRTRVDSRSSKVSKKDARAIYVYLHEWAIDLYKQEEDIASLAVLTKQTARLIELLDALPETELSHLELERIVRTIYEPAPVLYQAAEAYKLNTIHHAGAVHQAQKQLLWWDFFEYEKNYFFTAWYPEELAFLETKKLQLESPSAKNTKMLNQRKRPILWTQDQLILCVPDYSEGEAVQAHPLLGDLEASFGEQLDEITVHIDDLQLADILKHWNLPVFEEQKANPLAQVQPFVELEEQQLALRETETPTSIEQLLFYPYQWVFKHQMKLRKSSILSVVEDFRLYGNLAHRLIEKLLKQDVIGWSKTQVETWIKEQVPLLLKREGATLLLYGKEPERIAFIKYMKQAAWTLIAMLKENDWEVLASEYLLEGPWQELNIKGRADLVLKRANEYAIVDLKWRGASRYANVLRNGEDIQLAIYAKILAQEFVWPHTAYFIIDKAKMISHNQAAFKDAQAVQKDSEHEELYQQLIAQIQATLVWRKKQLTSGKIEVRSSQTHPILEELYGEQMLHLLEMKQENARFDDYDLLIGLVH